MEVSVIEKEETALEGRYSWNTCVLGRPGPCEHGGVHDVAGSEA